jgi:hypothetical protein
MESYGYAKVETALARVFGADAASQKGAFRGRIIHLRRLGLPEGGPGRGKTIAYTDEQVYQWLIALLLEEFGIDPALAVKMIKTRWDNFLAQLVRDASHPGPPDIALLVHVRFMSQTWKRHQRLDPSLGRISLTEEELAQLGPCLARPGKHVSVVNLSVRIRELKIALAAQEAPDGVTATASVQKDEAP